MDTSQKIEKAILNKINDPSDIRKLTVEELQILAQEIREFIIQTVSRTGGHLAPNLGVVELTLAIHYCFNTPKDVLIWDVGHQAYAHKVITGRRDRFHTLRQYGGISGFPRRDESPYDTLNTGHSSTSISAGLGMSVAKELLKREGKVICVIGDGSMTAGLAFEALNNAGHLDKDLIVILNDNEMSISRNVGALSSFLSRKLSAKFFIQLRKQVESFLESLPGIGENILQLARRSEDSFKTFFTPGMLFQALKFDYLGPIKGHRLDRLIEVFNNVKLMDGPVLVHVLTQKGKGYQPAEKDPASFHGVGKFEIESGNSYSSKSPPSYTAIFGQTMIEIASENPRVCAITAAMPEGTGLLEFGKLFPDRFFDVGIAEQHAVTFAAGLALEGLIPVVAIYSTFLQRAYDQIIHDVCLQDLHVVFAIDRGGIVGEDGPTHHGAFDLSYLRLLPGITLMAPKDENELRHMLYTAINMKGPVAIRYPRSAGLGVDIDQDFMELSIGRGELLRDGEEMVIFAIGSMVIPSLKAANILEKDFGLSAAVINARFVKPIDEELIYKWAKRTRRVLTVEENVLNGGFGSSIIEYLSATDLTDIKIDRLGIPDKFIEHGARNILLEKLSLDTEGIIKRALRVLGKDRKKFIKIATSNK